VCFKSGRDSIAAIDPLEDTIMRTALLRKAGIVAALVLGTQAMVANDTSAVLSTGGLEFIVNKDIEMLSEELFISMDEIRVVYEFRNNSDTDESVLVAFPMPDIVPDHFSPVAFPTGPDDNLFEFETTFDGQPVTAELHEYVYAAGVDRTALVESLGLPLVPITEAARDATDALDDKAHGELLRLGMLMETSFDSGGGWEDHYWPLWTYRATYTWDALFPAGETVTVEHRYRPSVGGSVGIAFLSEPYDTYDPAADYRQRYCTDEPFLSAVAATFPEGEPWNAPFQERWISYILTTGGNWGGPIGRFRLVIDKGSPENLLSFCGTNVRRIDDTTFEMVEEDFWPARDLEILILERNEPQT
jgi:hypothetical protein